MHSTVFFSVYILKCSDGSYYTGITNDIERRLFEHMEGSNRLSYTYTRRPLELVFIAEFTDPETAISVEKQIKRWSRKKKEALINDQFELLPELSKKDFNR